MTTMNTKMLLHGADYNFEQWLEYPEILDRDIKYMKKASCNVMSVGIFSWALLEPSEGEFFFDPLDSIIEKLYNSQIHTILATPSGSKPAWLSHAYPEVCKVKENGSREHHGSRHNHCRTSPIYRQKCVAINTELAKRYGGNDAVVLWHVSNEYNSDPCYCELCISEFRKWLQQRYRTLDALNNAWWTRFWSHTYTDWEQIYPSDGSVHGLMLDWKRFISDQTLDFFKTESKPLREFSPHIPITANFMQPDVGLNYWNFMNDIDIVSWDSYPNWHSAENDIETGISTAFYHDFFRSLKGQPFLLMESTPDVTNWQGRSYPKKPGMHLLSSLQAVAHGSNSVQYFQWRQSRGGQEKFHSAVISHQGHTDTKVFRNVSELGSVLSQISEINSTETRSDVVLLYDFENEWAIDLAQLPNTIDKNYQKCCITHYSAFWKLGISVDIKSPLHCDFNNYRIVVAPMMYMFPAEIINNLTQFVENGGIFVTTYLSGYVDESDLCYLGGAPGPLTELLGINVEENRAVYKDSDLQMDLKQNVKTYKIIEYADLIHTTTATPIAVFANSDLDGSAAITENTVGDGKAVYIGARCESNFYNDFYSNYIKDFGIGNQEVKKLPEGVTVQNRISDKWLYSFYMNFSEERHEIKLNAGSIDMLNGKAAADIISLPPYGIKICKIPRE